MLFSTFPHSEVLLHLVHVPLIHQDFVIQLNNIWPIKNIILHVKMESKYMHGCVYIVTIHNNNTQHNTEASQNMRAQTTTMGAGRDKEDEEAGMKVPTSCASCDAIWCFWCHVMFHHVMSCRVLHIFASLSFYLSHHHFFHGNAGNIGLRIPNARSLCHLTNSNVLLVTTIQHVTTRPGREHKHQDMSYFKSCHVMSCHVCAVI